MMTSPFFYWIEKVRGSDCLSMMNHTHERKEE